MCVQATCLCYKGYWGSDCSLPDVPVKVQGDTQCIPDCSGHGIHIGDPPLCLCERGYGGPNCDVGELFTHIRHDAGFGLELQFCLF